MTPTLTELYDTVPWGPAPESDKPAQAWLDAHKRAFGHFIGGAFTKPAKGFDVLNPATGGVLAKLRQSAGQDVDAGCGQLRSRVLLDAGKYRFEGKVSTHGVVPLKEPTGEGAGLRISGSVRPSSCN